MEVLSESANISLLLRSVERRTAGYINVKRGKAEAEKGRRSQESVEEAAAVKLQRVRERIIIGAH